MLLPTADHPNMPAAYVNHPKQLKTFSQSAFWCKSLGILNAANVAALLREFIGGCTMEKA